MADRVKSVIREKVAFLEIVAILHGHCDVEGVTETLRCAVERGEFGKLDTLW